MAFATTPGMVWDYVLQEDRDLLPEDPRRTVFELGVLDHEQRRNLDNRAAGATADGEVVVRVGDQNLEALRAGLRGWRQFHLPPAPDSDEPVGEEVPFELDRKPRNVLGRQMTPPSDKMFDHLSQEQIRELGVAVRESQHLTRDQVKA